MFWRFLTLIATAAAAAAAACTPSALVSGGCQLAAPAGVQVHYGLDNKGSVSFAVRAETEGFVSMWFVPPLQTSPFPGDAVVGAGHPQGSEPWTVVAVQLNGGRVVDIIESGVPVSGQSCVQDAGVTTLRFTRPLHAGRFLLNPNGVKFFVAVGKTDVFDGYNTTNFSINANLFAGTPAAPVPVPSPSLTPLARPSSPSPVPIQAPSPMESPPVLPVALAETSDARALLSTCVAALCALALALA